jgi:hypothetical protein
MFGYKTLKDYLQKPVVAKINGSHQEGVLYLNENASFEQYEFLRFDNTPTGTIISTPIVGKPRKVPFLDVWYIADSLPPMRFDQTTNHTASRYFARKQVLLSAGFHPHIEETADYR